MKIVVCGPQSAITEAALNDVNCTMVDGIEHFADHADADLFINFNEDALLYTYNNNVPVLVNSVLETLPSESSNLFRINGWPGFLQREMWEISGEKNDKVTEILLGIGKKTAWMKDEPGFVSARIIAMIINEAFFALEDKISTREEIDTAMKLGTGYPYGPFEWTSLIGQDRISKLLQLLAVSDARYSPSILLTGDIDHP